MTNGSGVLLGGGKAVLTLAAKKLGGKPIFGFPPSFLYATVYSDSFARRTFISSFWLLPSQTATISSSA